MRVPNARSHVGGAVEERPGVEKFRTERRSERYLQCLAQADATSGGALDVSGLIAAIEEEFGVAEGAPIGLVAECYLGAPYEVHVLDLAGEIVEHYHASQLLPTPFERARRLSLHKAYVAIEVYRDRLACLHADGTAVIIDQ